MHPSKTNQKRSMQIGVYLTIVCSLSADQKTTKLYMRKESMGVQGKQSGGQQGKAKNKVKKK